VTGLLALPGAVLLGWVWQVRGAPQAFLLAAALTTIAALSMLALALRVPVSRHGRG
jgi:hypothetical protein